jgi:hypothetical protein
MGERVNDYDIPVNPKTAAPSLAPGNGRSQSQVYHAEGVNDYDIHANPKSPLPVQPLETLGFGNEVALSLIAIVTDGAAARLF